MRESIEEMYKLASAKPPVHNTMKALLILLGYEGNLKVFPTTYKFCQLTHICDDEAMMLFFHLFPFLRRTSKIKVIWRLT
jgi:hypothetical protein